MPDNDTEYGCVLATLAVIGGVDRRLRLGGSVRHADLGICTVARITSTPSSGRLSVQPPYGVTSGSGANDAGTTTTTGGQNTALKTCRHQEVTVLPALRFAVERLLPSCHEERGGGGSNNLLVMWGTLLHALVEGGGGGRVTPMAANPAIGGAKEKRSMEGSPAAAAADTNGMSYKGVLSSLHPGAYNSP